MARRTVIRLVHRRRREGKTDYKQRLRLLKGRSTRLVVRRTLSGMICQLVEHRTNGDHVLLEVGSKKLKPLGWKYGLSSLPAAYLTGLLAGVEAKKSGISKAVLDAGLSTSTKGSRIYAALAGFAESGVEIPHEKKILPPMERASGKHIADYAAKLKTESRERYERQFSAYLSAGLQPESIHSDFEKVRKAISGKS